MSRLPTERIGQTRFYDDFSDCEWLRETHLRSLDSALPIPEFHSFVLVGNEDCPERIEVFTVMDPTYRQQPTAAYVLVAETGRYRDETIND